MSLRSIFAILAILALSGCDTLRAMRTERKALEAVPGVRLAADAVSPWVAVGRGALDASWGMADLLSGGKATGGAKDLSLLDRPPCPEPGPAFIPVTPSDDPAALPVTVVGPAWTGPSLRVKPVASGGMPVREVPVGMTGTAAWAVSLAP